jgi:hypothetical protein
MSDTKSVQNHKLSPQQNAARVATANGDLHGPSEEGYHKDKVATDQVRGEAAASTIPGADLARAAGTGNRARRRGPPIDRAWPFNAEDTSPLAWWRTLPSDRLGDAEALLVNTTLAKIDVMGGGDAPAAALRGEIGAGVTVALSLMPVGEVTLEVDLAMTAVLRGPLDGDGLAALVLAHVLDRADIDHPFATEISASWLTCPPRNSRRRFTKQEARLLAAMRERDELPAAGVGGKA